MDARANKELVEGLSLRRAGKVAEIRNHRDDLGLMEQLGARVFAGAPARQA